MTSFPQAMDMGGGLAPTQPAPQAPDQSRALEALTFDRKNILDVATDLRGSRRIAPQGSMRAAIAGIEDGNLEGLESLDFGSLPDGTPAASFTDENGKRQVIQLTPGQFFGGLQTRAANRAEIARRIQLQRQAEHLAPRMAPMVQELDQAIPGISAYAEMGLSEDPMGTFETLMRVYTGIKEGEREALLAANKMADMAALKSAQSSAELYAQHERDYLAESARGFITDESVPEDIRASRIQDIRRQQYEVDRFALLAPPTGTAARMASMPTYYLGQGQTEPIRELARNTIRSMGRGSIESLGPQGVAFAVQRAQRLASQIGWRMAWNKADVDIVASAIASELSGYAGMERQQMDRANQMGLAGQVRETNEETAAKRAGMAAGMEMDRAKIDTERARAEDYRAQGQARTARVAEDEVAARIERADPDIRTALLEQGIELPKKALIPAMQEAIIEAKADKSERGKKRLAALQEAVRALQRIAGGGN